MSLHINLLQPSEYRRQGVVSGAFLLRLAILAAVLVSLLFGGLTLLRHRNARQALASAREIWAVREPLYKSIMTMKQDLATYRKLAQELNGWAASRIEWAGPIRELQQLVHPSMQLRKLNIRGDTEIKIPRAAVRDDTGDKGSAKSAAKAAPPPPPPARQFFLAIEGRTSGHLAEDIVLQFDGALRRSAAFRTILASIRLQRLQSDLAAGGAQTDRLFALEATTNQKPMP